MIGQKAIYEGGSTKGSYLPINTKELSFTNYYWDGGPATGETVNIKSSTFKGRLTATKKFSSQDSIVDEVVSFDPKGQATDTKITKLTIKQSKQEGQTSLSSRFFLYEKSRVGEVEFIGKPGTIYYDESSKVRKVINGKSEKKIKSEEL